MMNSVSFVIPFVAVQQRARRGRYGKWYSPSSQVQEDIGIIALEARVRAGMPIFKGDCHVTLTCLGFDRKDLDNAIKLVLDACNKVLWEDDRQVVLIVARKIRVGEPRMECCVSQID